MSRFEDFCKQSYERKSIIIAERKVQICDLKKCGQYQKTRINDNSRASIETLQSY